MNRQNKTTVSQFASRILQEKVFILCDSTNWKVLFVFWLQAKKEKAS